MTPKVARALLACFVLMLVPLVAAQGGPPNGQPTGSPSTTPTSSPTTGGPPGSPGTDRPTPPPQSDSPQDARGNRTGPAVEIEDAQGGFGARPRDADSRRPGFSFNASRAAIAVDRAGAPGLSGMVDSLLEFRDEDGDGAYDVGEPVLQRHALANISAQIIAPAASIREASYPLSGNGSLVLRFHLEAGGVDEAVKFDVVIRNYAFTNPESRLALGMRMESTQAFRSGSVADEEALMGDGFGERPYVSWAADAVADNASVPVTAAVYLGASGHDALVFWSYAQAVSIEHDPWLGYVFVPVETLGDAVVFVGALVGGALVFLAGFEARRRFRP